MALSSFFCCRIFSACLKVLVLWLLLQAFTIAHVRRPCLASFCGVWKGGGGGAGLKARQ